MARDVTDWPRRCALGGLVLWGIGAQSLEGMASMGMAVCAAALLWSVLRKETAWRAGDVLRGLLPLLVFAAWALVAPLVSGRLPTWTGVARLLDWAAVPVAAWAFAQQSDRALGALLGALAAVFVASCAVAAFQYLGWWPALEAFEHFRWTGLPFHRVYEPVPHAEGRFMGGGLLFHRLKFAHVSSLGVLFGAALAATTHGRARAAAATVGLVGLGSVILFPHARAAILALVVALFVVAATFALGASGVVRKRLLWGGAALLLVLSVLVGINRPLRERFIAGATSQGSGEREKILATGVRAVEEHPLAGAGLGRFRPSQFAAPDTPAHILENAGKAHNQLLSMAAETGLVGVALFLCLLFVVAQKLPLSRPEGAAGLGALAFFLTLSMVHDPLVQAPFSMALSLSLGGALRTKVSG